jgi:hypothetical protein
MVTGENPGRHGDLCQYSSPRSRDRVRGQSHQIPELGANIPTLSGTARESEKARETDEIVKRSGFAKGPKLGLILSARIVRIYELDEQ